MKHARIPTPASCSTRRDWTLAECQAAAELAMAEQPDNVLFRTDPRAMTNALFAIAGKRVTKLGEAA